MIHISARPQTPATNYASALQEFLQNNNLDSKEFKKRLRDYAARTAANAREARAMASNMMKEMEFPVISEKVFKRLTTALATA